MNYKLKTSKTAMDILLEIKEKTGITPNILSRYAISIAINDRDISISEYFDSNGIEFNRNVLLGDIDEIFKLLIIQKENRSISDEEYFPKVIKSYFEHGIRILNGYSKLTKNNDNFIKAIIDSAEGGAIIWYIWIMQLQHQLIQE